MQQMDVNHIDQASHRRMDFLLSENFEIIILEYEEPTRFKDASASQKMVEILFYSAFECDLS